MKDLVLSLLFVLLVFSLCAETIIPAGNISGVWNQAGSPYRIMGNVTIQATDMLVLEAGTTVLFEGAYQMQVLGMIFSNGTNDNVITFTALDTLNGWAGIRFNNNASNPGPPSSFNYTYFLYGKAVNGSTASDPLNFGGAIWANNAGTINFTGCVFSHCRSVQDGSAIYAQNNSNIWMQNCTISDCDSGFFGGVFVKTSTAFFEGCTFKNNRAQTFGAALYFYQCPDAEVISCIISDNTAGAVTGIYSYSSPLLVKTSLLTGNSSTLGLGGGIGAIYGTLNVINCTLAGNTSPQGGGAIWINSLNSPATFTNNIFWNNTPVAITANTSTYTLSYNSLQTPEGDATNIWGDPMFTNSADGDFTLSATSPCIDMGTPDVTGLSLPSLDLAGLPRIVDGDADSVVRIDMGCYEWQVPVSTGTITGTVTNGQNQPLAGVAVTAGDYITVTDAMGNYTIVMAPGTYTMTATLTGYYQQTVDGVVVTQNEITFMYFMLEPVSNYDPLSTPQILNLQNQPNPFVMKTDITFTLSKDGPVRLEIYNLKGQKVKTLFTGFVKSGSHCFMWNGTDEFEQPVGKGIYLSRLVSGNQVLNRKLMKL